MKICKFCGAKNFDTETECYKCKASLSEDAVGTKISHAKKLIKIALLVTLLLQVTSIIALTILWGVYLSTQVTASIACMILLIMVVVFTTVSAVMANHYRNTVNSGNDVGLAFKICTFFFVSAIAGFAMICDE